MSNADVLVSVIIPAYNAEQHLRATLESVLAQSHRNLEVIVVDDGSRDGTRAVVEDARARDERIRYVYQANAEKAAARNTGVTNSRGEWIAFLDADDLWEPAKIARQLQAQREAAADIIYSEFRTIDVTGEECVSNWVRPATWGTLREDLLYYNVIPGSASSVLVRRSCLDVVGPFDSSLSNFGEDVDLWRRLAMQGFRFGHVNEPLVKIRVHAASASRGGAAVACRVREGERYAAKMRAELPDDLRAHGRSARYRIYLDLLDSALAAGRKGDATRLIARVAALGPRYWYGLLIDALAPRVRLVGRLLRPPATRVPRVHPWRRCDGAGTS